MTRLDRVIALIVALVPMTRSSRVMTNLPPVRHSFGPVGISCARIIRRASHAGGPSVCVDGRLFRYFGRGLAGGDWTDRSRFAVSCGVSPRFGCCFDRIDRSSGPDAASIKKT